MSLDREADKKANFFRRLVGKGKEKEKEKEGKKGKEKGGGNREGRV